MNIKEQIELLKAARIQEILQDASLSKIQKLKTIEKESLWGYADFIQHEFPEWEKEAIELERMEAVRILKKGVTGKSHEICEQQFYQSKMTDSIFDPSTFYYEKYQQVSYAEALEMALENHFGENEEEEISENPLMTIISTRHPRTELKKPYQEIVDVVFDFCVQKKIIGFKNDW